MSEFFLHENGISSSRNLHFSTWLHATQRLRWFGTQREADGNTISFLFLDPDRLMPELFTEFQKGALAPAMSLFSSLRKVRQEMNRF